MPRHINRFVTHRVLRLSMLPCTCLLLAASYLPVSAEEPGAQAQEHYQTGLQHKQGGDMTAALQELNAALDECPEYADAYWVRGWVQAELEDNEGACESFNAFIGLAPDDPRCEQAREAIGRLGGTVSPRRPGTPQDAGGTSDTTDQGDAGPGGPVPTAEQATSLLNEAAQALSQSQFSTAIEKCLLADRTLDENVRLQRILALSYAGLDDWKRAFEHADSALKLGSDSSLEFLRIISAIAQTDTVVAAGYRTARQKDACLNINQDYSEAPIAAWYEWNESLLLEDDGPNTASTLIGRAVSRLNTYYEQPEVYPVLMQLGHRDLSTALSMQCPEYLLPENNEWTSHLQERDLLWPQTEREDAGLREGLEWALKVRLEQTDEESVDALIKGKLAEYSTQPELAIEYQTGLALARHEHFWNYRVPETPIERLSTIPMGAARELQAALEPLLKRDNVSERVRQLAEFAEYASTEEQPVRLACKRLETAIQAAAAQEMREAAAEKAEELKRAQISRNTIQYLDKWLSIGKGMDTLTDAQRKHNWKQVEGQWVRWTGRVVDVRGGDQTCTVLLRCSPNTVTSDTTFRLNRETALSLSKGQAITVEGRLGSHNMTGYSLTNVRIVK